MATLTSRISKALPKSRAQKREARLGLTMLAPWLVGLLFLWILPMGISLYFSFTNYDPVKADQIKFVGLDNFTRIFTDEVAIWSGFVTFRFMFIYVPFSVIMPLLIALMITNKTLPIRGVFRFLFYLPSIIPGIAATLIFLRVFNVQTGWVNRILGGFGIEGPSWFWDANWVTITLVILEFWFIGAGMIQYIAALQNVPLEMYEAAKVDGAGPFRRFFQITLPLISSVIFYRLVFALIFAMQYFGNAMLVGGLSGNPDRNTLFYNVYLYRAGWTLNEMGYASALAWFLFILAGAVTIGLFASQKKWVFYATGD